jgi:hypothetical protein
MTEVDQQTNNATRCVIVVSTDLPPGRAANAASVIALTIGKLRPDLTGADLVDQSGARHPGLIPIGITVLAAPTDDLAAVRSKALTKEILVVAFPVQGQQTNDYSEFLAAVADQSTEDLAYAGVGLVGTRKAVGKIVGRYGLLR